MTLLAGTIRRPARQPAADLPPGQRPVCGEVLADGETIGESPAVPVVADGRPIASKKVAFARQFPAPK